MRIRWASTAGLGGEQALGQLEVAHLEGEQERRALHDRRPTWARIPSAKLVLPIAGRAPDDGEAGGLEAGRMLVEVVVPRGARPVIVRRRWRQLLDPVERSGRAGRAAGAWSRRCGARATSKTICSAWSIAAVTSSGTL